MTEKKPKQSLSSSKETTLTRAERVLADHIVSALRIGDGESLQDLLNVLSKEDRLSAERILWQVEQYWQEINPPLELSWLPDFTPGHRKPLMTKQSPGLHST